MSLIEDYAMIGDLQTAALVDRTGSIDWMCLPRFDSPACFAALVGEADNGHWRVAPSAGGTCTSRRYLPETLVLETTWRTPDGEVRVLDLMPPRGTQPDVVRIVEGVSGAVPVRSELRLRFGHGRIRPWVEHEDAGTSAVAGPDRVRLSSPVPMHGQDWATVGEVTVRPGERVPFVLTWSPSNEPEPEPVDAEQAMTDTVDFWHEWSERCTLPGPVRKDAHRSLITLKALTYAPTGGLVAAATTSLPESIGGERNWDYRFCWLRDAGMTLQALLAAGYTEEAVAWREWLLRAVAGDPSTLQIMYGIDGRRWLPEGELPWLSGYEGSKPVRTGNAASEQIQLDVYGETLDALALTRNAALSSSDDAWSLQSALMEHLEGAWQDKDNGLWEMRGPTQHFVHSKVMAWVAADRMSRAAERFDLPGPRGRWADLRDTIHAQVCDKGFDPSRNTFTQAYGSKDLDAALLLLPRVGFLPPDDPRVVGTVEAVQSHLGRGDGFVLRYDTHDGDDGLTGQEGVFVACSFWLVDALVGIGRHEQARTLYDRLLDLRNDVGLLSEEWDPTAGRHLGNTPQAFSHFALVASAVTVHESVLRRSDTPPPSDNSNTPPPSDNSNTPPPSDSSHTPPP